jgi:hypothetical protein
MSKSKSQSRSKKNKLTIDKLAPKALIVIAVVFTALIAVQFIAGGFAARPSKTPTVPSIYFSPSKVSSSVGSLVALDLRENSGTVPVNAIEIKVDYSSANLELIDFVPNQASFEIDAEYSKSAGSVSITRGSTDLLIGDQLVGRFTFKVLSKGESKVVINQMSSLVTTDKTDINNQKTYNIATTPESKGTASIRAR